VAQGAAQRRHQEVEVAATAQRLAALESTLGRVAPEPEPEPEPELEERRMRYPLSSEAQAQWQEAGHARYAAVNQCSFRRVLWCY
jgi:hypothetical protein